MTDKFSKLASHESINKAIENLKRHNIEVYVAKDLEDAKKKVFSIIPKNSEIMTMTSMTLETLNIPHEINESGKYKSVRKTLSTMERKTQSREMQKLGAAPEWAIGSVHAITEDGQIMIASNTGSQLPAYA